MFRLPMLILYARRGQQNAPLNILSAAMCLYCGQENTFDFKLIERVLYIFFFVCSSLTVLIITFIFIVLLKWCGVFPHNCQIDDDFESL